MKCSPPVIAWVCWVLVAASGCGFTGDADTFGEDTLLMNNLAEPSQLDPAMQTSVEDQRLTLALFEGLTSYHPRTLQPVVGMAESQLQRTRGRC